MMLQEQGASLMSVTGQWFSKIDATKIIWQKILPKSYVSKICSMVVLKILPNLTSPSKTSTNPYNFHSGGTFSTEEMAWWSVLSDGSMHLCDSLQCYIRNFGLRNICQILSNPQCHKYKRPRFFFGGGFWNSNDVYAVKTLNLWG